MKFYTGIGSRNTPVSEQEKITKIAAYLEAIGFVLRSGGADGADQAFERGVKKPENKIFWENLRKFTKKLEKI